MPDEQLLPLVKAMQQATGIRPALSTLIRWCQGPNKHGNVLDSWPIGGRRYTTVKAVVEYIERDKQAERQGGNRATPAAPGAGHDAAMSELDAVYA